MRFELATVEFDPTHPIRIGNVYPVRGGRGMKEGHMNILVGQRSSDRHCTLLTINREGEIVGATSYGAHYIEELQPIAFAEGVEDMQFVVRSI